MADVTQIKYLSLTGLATYDASIKAFVNSKVEAGVADSFKYVNFEDGCLRFYTINPILDDTEPNFEIELPVTDVSHLMQLVKDATAGNIATFGENGQVVDSGVAITDLATKDEVEAVQANVDGLAELVGELPEGTSAKSVVDYVNIKTAGIATDAALEELNNQVSGLQTAVQGIQNDYLTSEDKAELQGGIDTNAEAIAAIKEDVDAFFADADMTESAKDTLKELQEYIASDETGAAAMAASIKQNTDNITALQTDLGKAEETLATKAAQADLEAEVSAREALDARVIVVEGKAHEHANADELAKIADGDVAKWNGMEAKAAAYTDAEIDKVETVIGTVAENKTVVDMIADAQAAATYDDAEVKADIAENASAIETLTQTHATDKADLVAADEAMKADIDALKAVEHVEISEEDIAKLFPAE